MHSNKALTTVFLLFAILFEVAGTVSMKASVGFTYLRPSILIFAFYLLSFIFLALTLRRLEVTTAYAIWSGLGTLLLAIIGVLFFSETVTLMKIMGLSCIIIGVVGLRVA